MVVGEHFVLTRSQGSNLAGKSVPDSETNLDLNQEANLSNSYSFLLVDKVEWLEVGRQTEQPTLSSCSRGRPP